MQPLHHSGQPCTDYVHMHVQQTSGTVTIVEEAVDN